MPHNTCMKNFVSIGLMSGTSVDSIDAAAISVPGNTAESFTILGTASKTIPESLRELVFRLFEDEKGSLHNLALLNMRMGHLFAEAALELMEKLSLSADNVDVIGSHGQTVYHVAEAEECAGMSLRGSIQTGEASVIAQRTGIPVVSDFRVADIAAGGSGAPLVPFFDRLLLKQYGPNTVFQNIGGIANLSCFPASGSDVIAFDTGPGNMIIDALVNRYTDGAQACDTDGKIGRQGHVIPELLAKWMEHPYLSALPPKTTGREEFGTPFLNKYIKNTPITPDIIRTAEEYTARTIVKAYWKFLPEMPERAVIAGGGAFNPIIMDSLKQHLPGVSVLSGDEAGISTEFKEAAAFALLAVYYLKNSPNNIPSATGAQSAVVMGKLSRPCP